MFHRVKSETDYDTPETQEAEEAVVETNEPEVEETPSMLQEQAQQTAADVTESVEEAEEEAPAQNLYQRATSTATRAAPASTYSTRPAATAPTYSAPKPAARQEEPVEIEEDIGDRRLTIGRGITMSGEIESCDHLYVEGTVEAALKGANELEIAESGVFYGTVEIQDAIIAGRFEGEIIVHGSLTVESTGVITGSITYSELSVESGAVIDGRITPISAAQPAAQSQPTRKSSAKRAATKASPANEELFEAAE